MVFYFGSIVSVMEVVLLLEGLTDIEAEQTYLSREPPAYFRLMMEFENLDIQINQLLV